MESVEIFALFVILFAIGILVFFIVNFANHIDSESKKKALLKNTQIESKTISKTNDLDWNIKSISSFVLSILGILGLYLLSYLSIVLGILAIREISKNKNRYKGRILTIVGLVIGIIGTLVNIGQYYIYK